MSKHLVRQMIDPSPQIAIAPLPSTKKKQKQTNKKQKQKKNNAWELQKAFNLHLTGAFP